MTLFWKTYEIAKNRFFLKFRKIIQSIKICSLYLSAIFHDNNESVVKNNYNIYI